MSSGNAWRHLLANALPQTNAAVPLRVNIPKLPAEVVNVAAPTIVAEMRCMDAVVEGNLLVSDEDNVAAGEHDCVALTNTASQVSSANVAATKDVGVCTSRARDGSGPDPIRCAPLQDILAKLPQGILGQTQCSVLSLESCPSG